VRRYRILLIEDNPADVHLIREALTEKEVAYDLDTIDDGEVAREHISAIEAGRKPRPDIILLDLNLPKVTGDVLLKRIRQSASMADIPVMVLTSSDSPRDRTLAEKLGASAYIRKPSNLEEFMAIGENVRRRLGGAPA
jgi:two-component system, chemotaxis family, response regulator Rcp1